MRAASHPAVLAALLLLPALVALAPAPARAQVRLAVVGFSGDLDPARLSELAVSIRGSLHRQADPKVLAVVSREEMGAVYRTRGAPCSPEDLACIVAASEAWRGRLFVRGVVRETSEGIIVTATLESVRGFPVAAAQTPVAKGRDVEVAVPILVRELLDGERHYREKMARQVRHPAAVEDEVPVAPAPAGDARCRGTAVVATYVPGELFIDDRGLRFESVPDAATKVSWRYGWAKVAAAKATTHDKKPALQLQAHNGDELVVYFDRADARSGCLGEIERRRSAHR